MNVDPSLTTRPRISLRRTLVVLLIVRTILNTELRAVYPYLPAIASNLNVPFESAAQIIQIRDLSGIASPLFGPLSDRYGRRALMLLGMTLAAATGIALYFVMSLQATILVMTLMGLSILLYVPAQQAFLGDNVPYRLRGRVMAIAEFAWSLAAIVGLPVFGYLVKTQGWRLAFVAFGLSAAAAIVLVWLALPHTERNVHHATRAFHASYLEALRAPMALAVLGTTFLLAAANENVYVVFSTWMNRSFGLDPVALGLVASAIGGAEFTGELAVAAFIDRFGKWRMVAGSMVLGGLAYVALAFFGVSALSGTLGLVAVFFSFEAAVVGVLPLMSEIAPNVRATLLSMGLTGFSLGRAMGAFIGPAIYVNMGFSATSLVSASGVLVAFLIWILFVREKHAEVVLP